VGDIVERLKAAGARNCICARMVANPTNHHPQCPVHFYAEAATTISTLQAEVEKLRDALEMTTFQLETITEPHMRDSIPGALAIQCGIKAKIARQALAGSEGDQG
jgi:hypothetical protein